MEDDIFAAVAVRASSETEQPGQLPSSSDLAIPHPVLLPLVSVYKVLVQHFNLAHLIFEEFCAAVAHHDQSSIVSDVHVALLDELIAKVCTLYPLYISFITISYTELKCFWTFSGNL